MPNNIKDIVTNPHPIYTRNADYWRFLLDSYEGGADYTNAFVKEKDSIYTNVFDIKVNGKSIRSKYNTNLFEHKKELYTDFQKRIDMSYYYNFCAPVVDIYTNHIFKEAVNIDYGAIEQSVMERDENIDNTGSSVSEFRNQIAEDMQIFGHTFILVDSPNASTNIFNMQDKIDLGVFPYFTNINPLNVINWSTDKFGSPNWVVVSEWYDTTGEPDSFNKEKRVSVNYRMWTKTEWILYNSEYIEIERGAHNLGFVPIVAAYDKRSKKYKSFLGVSFIADIAFVARDIYNSCSELKQILRDQTFSILAVQGDASDYPAAEVGTNKGLVVPRDVQMPQYITPPPGPAEVLMKYIDNQISRIYQLAMLEGGSASYRGQVAIDQSGVSKAWDFNQTNSALAMKAANLEDAETRLWQMFAAWEGREFDGSINYPREFSVSSLKQDLDESEQAIRLNISKEFNKEIKRAIVKKRFPRLSDEIMGKIDDEIDSAVSTDVRISDRIQNLISRTPTGGLNGGAINARRDQEGRS